jgi:cytochrome P450
MTTLPDHVTEEWCTRHYDFSAQVLGEHLYDAMAQMRQKCPVARTDAHNGQWIVSAYQDVVQVGQDWRTFSSRAYGGTGAPVPLVPITLDPPLHASHRQIVSPYFTAPAMSRLEDATRKQARELLSTFHSSGSCEFMGEFARPYPGLILFHEVLHAPTDEISDINELATHAGIPGHPKEQQSWVGMVEWVRAFVERRKSTPPHGDVVDAIIGAHVNGEPLPPAEVIGTLVLLIMGGLETTAGALGHFFVRFAQTPEVPEGLRQQPELIPEAVEELLRLDVPFVHLQRQVAENTILRGQQLRKGDTVLISLAGANRDEAEFERADTFDLHRPRNRHIAFGVGPHRCLGSNLARANLVLALDELLPRMHDIALQPDCERIDYLSVFNRSPKAVPLSFKPTFAA